MFFFLDPKSAKAKRYHRLRAEARVETTKVVEWIDKVSAELSDKPEDMAVRGDLVNICRLVTTEMKNWELNSPASSPYGSARTPTLGFSEEVLKHTIELAVKMDQRKLFLAADEIWFRMFLANSSFKYDRIKSSVGAFTSIGVAFVRFDLPQ